MYMCMSSTCVVHSCIGTTVRSGERANLDPSKFKDVCYECWKGLAIQRMNAKTGRCQHQKVFTSAETLCSPDEALLALTCTINYYPTYVHVLYRAACNTRPGLV